MAYPERGSYNPTPEERQERIRAYARGASHFDIMRMFKISYSASVQFKKRWLPEIEAEAKLLDAGITDLTTRLWVNDQVAQYELRQHLAEAILERIHSGDLDDKALDRFTRSLDQLLYKSAELAGLIKQRVQAEVESGGRITYDIGGLDLNEVVRSWGQGSEVSEPESEPEPVEEPKPVPESREVPPEFLGKAPREAVAPEEPARKPIFK